MPATHRRRTAGLAVAALAALTGAAAPAGAAPSGTGSAQALRGASAPGLSQVSQVSEVARLDAAAQSAALAYWTPERIAAARPAPAPRPVAGEGAQQPVEQPVEQPAQEPAAGGGAVQPRAAAGTPVVPRRERSTAGEVTGAAVSVSAPWRGGAAVRPKVGRLLFTQGGTPYECSASSVRAGNASVLVTAGHCLTDGGRDSTNVVYLPGLDGAATPLGRWSAVRTFTTAQWREEDQNTPAALNHDVGFVVVGRQDGAALADRAGAFELAFDAPLERVTVFGYPAAGPGSDGTTLQHCTGWRFPDEGGTTDQGTLCDMASGSSGGPWLSRFDPVAGTGTVTSVVSFSYGHAPERLYGPRLGAVEREVFERAAAVPVP
ncbi:trypsin-like serine peptidase [Kineococcus gypseus]|uniref:trypsin-like serine peptidase n=1 Tax=Kineococcus gypseus TaxID=1637102 RepID=UPI003D7EEF90